MPRFPNTEMDMLRDDHENQNSHISKEVTSQEYAVKFIRDNPGLRKATEKLGEITETRDSSRRIDSIIYI